MPNFQRLNWNKKNIKLYKEHIYIANKAYILRWSEVDLFQLILTSSIRFRDNKCFDWRMFQQILMMFCLKQTVCRMVSVGDSIYAGTQLTFLYFEFSPLRLWGGILQDHMYVGPLITPIYHFSGIAWSWIRENNNIQAYTYNYSHKN